MYQPMTGRRVQRPPRSRSQYPVEAVIETLDTNRAYRIDLDGRDAMTVVASLYRLLRRRGYQLRYRREGSALIAWAERLPDSAAPKRRRATA
jgi:hypothetical protein